MMVSQVAILHYFIYFSLSWDIMEPVTVILGNFDLFFGYYYFIVRGKDFSFENFEKGIIEARLNKYLKKNGVDVDKYE